MSAQALETLDFLCQRYSQRPSTYVGITDPLEAYRFDLAVATAGVYAEQRSILPTTPTHRQEPATFNPRKGPQGKVAVVEPTPEQAAAIDALFPDGWFASPSSDVQVA